jgi:hypothetical protein
MGIDQLQREGSIFERVPDRGCGRSSRNSTSAPLKAPPAPSARAPSSPQPNERSWSVLQANALDLLRVGDLDLPARHLQLVVHEAGAVHRLDRGVHRVAEPADPVGQRGQPAAVGDRRGHRQRRARLVHQVNISRVRLRSNPTCTMTTGLLPTRSAGPAPASVPPGEAPGFMTFIPHTLR